MYVEHSTSISMRQACGIESEPTPSGTSGSFSIPSYQFPTDLSNAVKKLPNIYSARSFDIEAFIGRLILAVSDEGAFG